MIFLCAIAKKFKLLLKVSPPPVPPPQFLSSLSFKLLSSMEKRLRSSLQNSSDSFLESAIKHPLKSLKPSIKTLINSIKPSSETTTSLPISLHSSILSSINSFKTPSNPKTPPSPPSKKPRKSSRNSSINTSEDTQDTHQKTLLHNLQIYAYIALICTKHPKKAFLPEDLFPCVRELHDNLILFENDTALLGEISNLCEEWWKEEHFGRELLISQFLPFLLSRSLTLRKKVDVHRVYVLREAFVLFDFEDESIEDLKLLLMRCVITPLYLKTNDGRRFIAFLFELSPQLLKEVLAMIRAQIPFGRKSMLEAYGEILFRCWKSVDDDSRREIEDGFLQGLIEGATYANSAPFAASIRRVLGGFTNQRTTDGVEKLLFRLAEPVIFRSLQVANSNVRQNALHLLLDLFPLEDPDATKEAKDTLLEKQFFLLEKLLKDDCPEVRVVAVEGCCRTLRLFWEIIPSSTITRILTVIFYDMSHDISSEVRLSTLNGVIYLLGNPQAHEILKVLLPRLGNMILDPVISIRIAVADLLLLIMDIRGFQFIKVVNLEVLLNTLTDDQSVVAHKITQLLMPSYFPSKVNVSEACSRLITLIKRSPVAGARFCEFSVEAGASVKSLMELTRVLVDLVLSSDGLDKCQVKGIFAALSHLCRILVNESSRRDRFKELFSGEKLNGLLAPAVPANAQSTLFDIISTISPAGISGIFEECLAVITNCSGLPLNQEIHAEIRSAHKLLLSCGWFDKMSETLSRLLQDTAVVCRDCFSLHLPREIVPSAKRKKCGLPKLSRKGKSVNGNGAVSFKKSYKTAVGIAWQIKDLLASNISRETMLKSKPLTVAALALKVISEASIAHSLCNDYMDASLVDSYTTLSLCMTLQNITVNDSDDTNVDNADKNSKSVLKATQLDEALDLLLNCTEKILNAGGLTKFGTMSSGCKLCCNRDTQIQKENRVDPHTDASSSDDEGSPFVYRRRMVNLVKICTVVMKFIADVAAIDLLSHNQQKCLNFTSTYIQSMISMLKRCNNDELKFQDEQLRELHVCLKSSFSYVAKLVNVVLASSCDGAPAPLEVYDVANHLLDLITSVELYCGSSYAARIVTLAKQWLPDVILGLGSRCILKQSLEETIFLHLSSDGEMHVHPWLSILANTELLEMRCSASDEEDNDKAMENDKFPALKKLIVMMVQLLQLNHEILDAVGLVFLLGSATGLQRKEYGLVLGLARFAFGKLVNCDNSDLGKFNMMLSYLQELYPQVECRIEETDNNEGLEELLSIKAVLEPAWLYSCEARDPV